MLPYAGMLPVQAAMRFMESLFIAAHAVGLSRAGYGAWSIAGQSRRKNRVEKRKGKRRMAFLLSCFRNGENYWMLSAMVR